MSSPSKKSAPETSNQAAAHPAEPGASSADESVIDAFFKPAKPVATAETAESEDAQSSESDSEAEIETEEAGPQRCGLIAIVGKPNVGKSTLLNSLVGQKVSITSRKAQTTRHRILGMRSEGAAQFIFADTPGFQTKHGNALNRSLNKAVSSAVTGVDLVLLVVEAGRFNAADDKVISLLKGDVPVILIVNKLDQVKLRGELAPWLKDVEKKFAFKEIVPLSAKNPKDIARLLKICESYLPEQPWIYAADDVTDKSERFMVAEVIREKLFRLLGDELPYTSTVVIDQFKEEPGRAAARFIQIAATIIVERDSHKAMVIGEGGEHLKRISTEARVEMEKMFDAKVFLQCWVKVNSGWADNAARVKTFGYE